MENDLKKYNIPACDDFSLMSGQIARNELQHSNTETTPSFICKSDYSNSFLLCL